MADVAEKVIYFADVFNKLKVEPDSCSLKLKKQWKKISQILREGIEPHEWRHSDRTMLRKNTEEEEEGGIGGSGTDECSQEKRREEETQ